MLTQLHSFTVFTAFVLCTYVALSNAGHVHSHRHLARPNANVAIRFENIDSRAKTIEFRKGELRHQVVKRDSGVQQLQSEFDAFSQFMTNWFASPNATNAASSISQVNDEFQAYESQLNSWLQDAVSKGDAAPATSSEVSQLQSEVTAFTGWMSDWVASAGASDSASAIALLQNEILGFEGWMKAWLSAAGSGNPAAAAAIPAPPTSVSSLVAPTTLSTIAASTSSSPPSNPAPKVNIANEDFQQPAAAPASSSATPSPSPSSPPPAPVKVADNTNAQSKAGSSSGGSFNAQASDNVAVYYNPSQTDPTSLSDVCADSSVNIVILAFINGFNGDGTGYPSMDFGFGSCDSTPNSAMSAAGATGLRQCDALAKGISSCQSGGKKVLVSIGGSAFTSTFSSEGAGQGLAQTLWNIFGGGTPSNPSLRPFGSVKVDGFDIDNEIKDQTGWKTLTSSLRTLSKSDTTKTYYLSAAPQCVYPDASIPMSALAQMDFVWVQFYNNGACNVGGTSFVTAVTAWQKALSAGSYDPSVTIWKRGEDAGPKLYVGMLASAAGGTGYNDPVTMASQISQVKGSIGGGMLWNAGTAVGNGNYQQAVKKALG